MYGFKITEEAKEKIKQLSKTKYEEGLWKNLLLLNENPLSRAKPTKKRIHGEYYINCGNQHCIVFDFNKEVGIVNILRVLRKAHLHKILIGRLQQ